MKLTQIDDRNFIVTPTNQPLPSTDKLTQLVGTTNYTVNTQTTGSTVNRRDLASDNRGNWWIESQSTNVEPRVTHVITIND